MIIYSLSSVMMAVLACMVLMTLLSICLLSHRVMKKAGYKILSLFLIVSFLRFLFPIEIFGVAKNICLPEGLSKFIQKIRTPIWIGDFKISAWTVFEIIWLLGIIILLVNFIYNNIKSKKFVNDNSIDITDDEKYKVILSRVCSEKGINNHFRILNTKGIEAPLLFGIFKPCILIPETLDMSDEDMYYILCHEITHYKRHDLWFKTIIKFIRIIYWWYAVVYLFAKRADLIIEMRVDDDLTKDDNEVKHGYMKCLLTLAEKAQKGNPMPGAVTTSFFVVGGETDLEKRFALLSSTEKHKSYFMNIALTVLVVGIYISSYLFIFEAFYNSFDNTLVPTLEDVYIIETIDGTFDLYAGGMYIETIDDYNDEGYKDFTVYYLERGNTKK